MVVSNDGGAHFRPSNDGFDHRQMAAVAFDAEHRGRILAVLAHAPEPVLMTDDGGKIWLPLGPGLTMRKLKRLFASPDGWWATLEAGGLMRYDPKRSAWQSAGTVIGAAAQLPAETKPQKSSGRIARGRSSNAGVPPSTGGRALNWVVSDMAFSNTLWFAATEHGLLFSEDQGARWQLLPLGALPDLPVSSVRVSSDAQSLWVVSPPRPGVLG